MVAEASEELERLRSVVKSTVEALQSAEASAEEAQTAAAFREEAQTKAAQASASREEEAFEKLRVVTDMAEARGLERDELQGRLEQSTLAGAPLRTTLDRC